MRVSTTSNWLDFKLTLIIGPPRVHVLQIWLPHPPQQNVI